MNLSNKTIRFIAKVTVALTTLVALSACENSSPTTSSENAFNSGKVLDFFMKNGEICDIQNMHPGTPLGISWMTRNEHESIKYSWTEWGSSDGMDSYLFMLNDPKVYKGFETETAMNGHKCKDLLSSEITRVSKESGSKNAVLKLRKIAAIQETYTAILDQISSLPIQKSNRSSFMDLEDLRRTVLDQMENAFFELRQATDYTYINGVKVFVEKCATHSAFHEDDGVLILTNDTENEVSVQARIRFRDGEGMIVGDTPVFESVPAHSKMRSTFSGYSASGAFDGYSYPPMCFFN